jgi:hypothetical protein
MTFNFKKFQEEFEESLKGQSNITISEMRPSGTYWSRFYLDKEGIAHTDKYYSGEYCDIWGVEHPSKKGYFYEICEACGEEKFVEKGLVLSTTYEEDTIYEHGEFTFFEDLPSMQQQLEQQWREGMKRDGKCSNEVCEEAKLFWDRKHPIQKRINQLYVAGSHVIERSRFSKKTPDIDYEDGGYVYALIGLYYAEARYRQKLIDYCGKENSILDERESVLGMLIKKKGNLKGLPVVQESVRGAP